MRNENIVSELWKRYIRTSKTLHPNFEKLYPIFENAISELSKRYIRTLKRYIRTLKTLYPNFQNLISELWKRYIRILKTLYPNLENFMSELWKHPNFNLENVTSELWNVIYELKTILISRLKNWTNEQNSGQFRVNWKTTTHCNSRAFFPKEKSTD